jgi:hypothetical protein
MNDEGFEFVEISMLADDRGTMDERGLTDICDDMHMEPVTKTLRPPYHPNCFCTVVAVIRPKDNEVG